MYVEPTSKVNEPWAGQDENGIDIARLRLNLAMSYEERVQRLIDAAAFFEEVDRAAEANRLRKSA